MNHEEEDGKKPPEESKTELLVTTEQKVDEVAPLPTEESTEQPKIQKNSPEVIVLTENSQHLSTSSENSDTPLIPPENTQVQPESLPPPPTVQPKLEPKPQPEPQPELDTLSSTTTVPDDTIITIPKINVEIAGEERKMTNSEKLKRMTQERPLSRKGSLNLLKPDDEEEIFERHSIDVPVQKSEPNVSIKNDVDIRPSLDYNRKPTTPIHFERKSPKRPKLDLPLMKFIQAKPKVIHVRKRSWNQDNFAFHAFQHQVPTKPKDEEEEEILERKSFSVMRDYDPKFKSHTGVPVPRRRSEDGFGRSVQSTRVSLNDDMPPLEDPEDYDPEKQEELSTIGKRIEMKKEEYERTREKYENRYRFDPRFYFFFHLAWILCVGFFGGLIIYLIELNNAELTFMDSVFMAFSACTVTGLFVVNFGIWSIYGQIAIFICICKKFSFLIHSQVLGTITLTTVPLMIIRCCEARKRMFYERILHPDRQHNKNEEKVPLRKSLITVTKAPPTSDIEYLAYKHAIIILLVLQGTFQFTSFMILGFYLQFTYTVAFLNAKQPFWCALFLTFSAWGNAGFTPFPDNLVRFRNDVLVNVVIFIMAQCGNTLFPFIYRTVISILVKIPSKNQVVYQFILDHHHRMTIHCFPATQTKVYAITSIALQCLGFFGCMIMEYSNKQMEGTFWTKIMIALFHSGSSRTSGFNTIDISAFFTATLMIYVLMMRTKPQMLCSLSDQNDEIANIAEDDYQLERLQEARMRNETKNDYTLFERDNAGNTVFESLLSTAKQFFTKENVKNTVQSWLDALKTFVNQYLGRVRSTNVWLMIVIFLIAVFEREKFVETENENFTIFKLIFEVISAFGNVGLSLGYPGLVTSFVSVFTDYSKLLIIFVMIMGRHRGLFGAMQDQNVDFVLD